MNFFYTSRIFAGIGIGISVLILSSCNSENTTTVPPTSDTTNSSIAAGSDQGFFEFPSPVQQVQLLQQAGATYDKELLNPLENVSKYIVTNSKALNLGVYGADLSYAAVFNQPQDVVLYLNTCQRLANELNIKGDFHAEMMRRIDKNGDNRDSLLRIVSDVFQRSNASLKENDQSHISALVVVGSFVEAMFIATQVAQNVKAKEAIYSRISGFRGSLNNLVAIITTAYDNDFANVLPDLKSIKMIYDESENDLNQAQIDRLTRQIKAVRIKLTNM